MFPAATVIRTRSDYSSHERLDRPTSKHDRPGNSQVHTPSHQGERNVNEQGSSGGYNHGTYSRMRAGSVPQSAMGDSSELVGGTAEKRNWRGIIISLLVILLICSLIVVAIIVATPGAEEHVFEKFTFDDIFDEQYKPQYFDAVWFSENEYIMRDSTNNIVAVDISGNKSSILITNRTMDEEGIIRVWVNADKEHILVSTQERKLYRSSFEAIYKIYEVSTKSISGTLMPPGVSSPVHLQYATWAPTNTALVFVYQNNLYYQTAVGNDPVAITDTGVEGQIFNGVPDWVYEEEILDSNNAIYWYEDGTLLLFASFNDTDVPKAWYPYYDNKVYSEVKYISYPKPGYTNPVVKLYVMSTNNQQNLVHIKPPAQFQDQDHYFKSAVWKDQYQVTVTWWNRPQNISLITLCQVDSGVCDVNYEHQTPNGWIVQRGDIIFADGGESYFTILPQREGPKGNYYHIAQVTSKDAEAGEVTFLTQGQWEVTSIVAYNKDANTLYFLSTEFGPGNRTMFSLNVATGTKSCITCKLMNQTCTYFSAMFNNEATRYFLQCHGPWVPKTTLHAVDSSNYTTVQDNAAVVEAYKDKDYVVKRLYKTESKDGNYQIPIELLVPREIDTARKHPLMIDVYGGPGSQNVDSKFIQGWYTYLMSNYHIIVARIDGRGSGYKGEKMMYELYRRLGSVEIEDQVTGTNFLLETEKFLDWNKTAIWGWSYGGFASTLAAAHGIFNCTMAVAPVTDWRFY
ncbi:A-type potassium channel modulatory protein DPP6-like, partial [Diadema antillarum]|uniref:A-type potassium channel modulatory protein DPP6-like n=1 Tax=Diadema antillarum TaxID=105358 RepID=UPI003A8BFF76